MFACDKWASDAFSAFRRREIVGTEFLGCFHLFIRHTFSDFFDNVTGYFF